MAVNKRDGLYIVKAECAKRRRAGRGLTTFAFCGGGLTNAVNLQSFSCVAALPMRCPRISVARCLCVRMTPFLGRATDPTSRSRAQEKLKLC